MEIRHRFALRGEWLELCVQLPELLAHLCCAHPKNIQPPFLWHGTAETSKDLLAHDRVYNIHVIEKLMILHHLTRSRHVFGCNRHNPSTLEPCDQHSHLTLHRAGSDKRRRPYASSLYHSILELNRAPVFPALPYTLFRQSSPDRLSTKPTPLLPAIPEK